MKNFCRIALAYLALLPSLAFGQSVNEVLSFSGALGSAGGVASLAQGRDSRLYGTTSGDRNTENPDGAIFRVNTDGTDATVLLSFNGTNGQLPGSGLMLATDGNYYGVTYLGGVADKGVLYKVGPTGVYTTVHQFTDGSDGQYPTGKPMQASDGNLYGVTGGTIYKYVPSTQPFTTILTLSADSQGSGISESPIQASDGSLYGTASNGGAHNCGTIFRLITSGILLSVYSFPCRQGGNSPLGSLLQASDGNLYGTTAYGGNTNSSGECSIGCGTIFKLSHGIVSVIYRFSGYPNDGYLPNVRLVEGTDGKLYGTTDSGGANDFGTFFQITTSGQYALLHSFVNDDIGTNPAGLMQHTNGKFYGSTGYGGQNSDGSLYSLDMGLGPFIALVRYTGSIGQPVEILGQGFTGTTIVTINGVAATSFKVVSDTFITAVVPTGATTGPVVVTTPTGSLTSNHNLQIVH